MIANAARGAAAGALGTAALNLVTYLDVAVRGRPPSQVPADTVKKAAEAAHVDLSPNGDEAVAEHRATGLGALAGYAAGIGVGALYGAVRNVLPGRKLPLLAVGVGGAAMAAGDVPSIVSGATDPRKWGATGWLADIVPHLAYGAVTVAALDRLMPRRRVTAPARP